MRKILLTVVVLAACEQAPRPIDVADPWVARQRAEVTTELMSDCLRFEPDSDGRAQIDLVVGASGEIELAELDPSTTYRTAGYRHCVTQQMYALHLEPPPGGPVSIDYTATRNFP